MHINSYTIPNLTVEENQKSEKPYTTGVLRLLLSKDMLYGVRWSEIFFDYPIQFFRFIVKAVQRHSCETGQSIESIAAIV